MAEENQGSFKVTDRRLFNADGTLREDALIEEAAPAQTPEPQPTVSAGSAQSQRQFAAAAAPELQPEPPQLEDVEPERTMFNEFLMGIASSAFIYLGLVEHPATGRRQVDMTAAKESIDMLVMLREKTKGNLTGGEEKFFDDLLSDLKMQYVSMRR
ncbi:MAG TPA: DUF1844 domain-containing protein [Blastocatellia bacterium]|jgi:hypothetical protein|nr:DUF1844 domain-containing protein [Blastocatellia bacterium]